MEHKVHGELLVGDNGKVNGRQFLRDFECQAKGSELDSLGAFQRAVPSPLGVHEQNLKQYLEAIFFFNIC